MKKVLLLFIALFVALSVNAQADVIVGPKIGYQTSKLSFKGTSIKQDFQNDMAFGVFTRFTFPNLSSNQNCCIQQITEALYRCLFISVIN